MSVIDEKLKNLPDSPGVYVMYDENGQVIYVGKAKNLKRRVKQYFFNGVKTEKVMAMVSRVKNFDYIIAKSEIDALSLEDNLIKKHKPKYNILLKDDKTYPYIKIDLKEDFPYLTITRKLKKDGAKYFGPFMAGINANEIMELVNLTYKLRPCKTSVSCAKKKKECLNYHIGRCFAPCAGKISREEYMKSVEDAIDFLAGGSDDKPKELLTAEMLRHSEREEFESALLCREKLKSLEKLKLKRITNLSKFIDADVIGIATNKIYTAFSVLIIRSGRMLGAKTFDEEDASLSDADALSEFLSRYCKNSIEVPSEIIIPVELEQSSLIENYFAEKFSKTVTVITPKQGMRKQLIDMATVNAEEYLDKSVSKIKHKAEMTVIACQKLQRVLKLSRYPKRMECYDISHISGVDKVGAMTVFIDGEKATSEYRRFKIKTVEGNNDFECLKEVLRRRLAKLGTDEEEKFPKPDLIVIDGGKGQLSSVKEVFDEFNITDIDLISLAEREEEIYRVGESLPVMLDRSDYALRVLQRIRDEAHRFAITFNRSLRGKRSLSSVLDDIEGIGKVKRQALLDKFKDLSGLMSATKEEILTVDGIGEVHANAIIEKLKEEGIIKNNEV